MCEYSYKLLNFCVAAILDHFNGNRSAAGHILLWTILVGLSTRCKQFMKLKESKGREGGGGGGGQEKRKQKRKKKTCFFTTISTLHSSPCRTILLALYNECCGPSDASEACLLVVCWLLNVPATRWCISGTDLLRQFYVLPH